MAKLTDETRQILADLSAPIMVEMLPSETGDFEQLQGPGRITVQVELKEGEHWNPETRQPVDHSQRRFPHFESRPKEPSEIE